MLSVAFIFFSHTFVLASVEFNSWHYHASALAGNWIYIDGGLVPYKFDLATSKWIYGPANKTYALDLSQDWTSSNLTMITSDQPFSLLSQSLWFDGASTIYCFGGDVFHGQADQVVQNAPPAAPEFILGLTLDGKGRGFWSQSLGPTAPKPFPRDIYRSSSGASATDSNSGYYIAGFLSKLTSPSGPDAWIQSPGMLKFWFDGLELTNSSDGGFPLSHEANHDGSGAMINIPNYGTNGILALLGGGNYQRPMAFRNITLYDKSKGKWYYQLTSGDLPDLPEPRVQFCAVGIQGRGDSFEIFVHGGRSIATTNPGPPCDELFILSLPAFRWFRANYSSSSFPRHSHTCHATNTTNQMIMVGGEGHKENDTTSADPTNHGIAVFDMTKLEFKNSYQANAPAYEPPEMLQRYYSADSNNRYPSSWTTPEVKELFEGIPSSTIFNSSCIMTAPARSCRATRPGLSSATITGLVLGCIGVFLLILTATVCTFCVKRENSPCDHDDNGKAIICVDVQELAAEQATQEIMTERKDRAEMSA